MNDQKNHDPLDRTTLPSTENTVVAHRLRRPAQRSSALRDFVLCAGFLLVVGAGIASCLVWGFLAALGLSVAMGMVVVLIGSRLGDSSHGDVVWPSLETTFSTWDALVNGIIRSPNKTESAHAFGGVIDRTNEPLLLHSRLLDEHMVVFGKTGTGKSARGVLPLVSQMIRRRDSSIVFLDLKGGRAEFASLGLEAKHAGLNFRWFTTETGKSSYLFNPFLQGVWRRMSENEKTQVSLSGLGSDFGDTTSGTAYFGGAGEARLKGAFSLCPDARSLRQLSEIMREPDFRQRIGMSQKDFDNSGAVQTSIDRLTIYPQVNGCPEDGISADVFAGAIDVEQILAAPQVVYFNLPSTIEVTTSRAMARLFIRLLVAAARLHGAKRTQVYVVIDEFQEIVQRSLAAPIKQCRDLGISLWMALQQASDLVTRDMNFLETVLGNTSVRIFFSALDPLGREYLTKASGEWRRLLRGSSETITRIQGQGTNVGTSTQIHETIAPRISPEDLNRLNATDGLCVIEAAPHSGFTRLNYPAFVRAPYCISKAEYKRRELFPWPKPNKFTLVNDLAPPPNAVIPSPELPPEPQVPNGEHRASEATDKSPSRKSRRPRTQRDVQITEPSPVVEEHKVDNPADFETNEMANYLRKLAEGKA